jgi:hypothetical protein
MRSVIEKGFDYGTISEKKKKENLEPVLYHRPFHLGISDYRGRIYSWAFCIHVHGFLDARKRHHENALPMDTQRLLLAKLLAGYQG